MSLNRDCSLYQISLLINLLLVFVHFFGLGGLCLRSFTKAFLVTSDLSITQGLHLPVIVICLVQLSPALVLSLHLLLLMILRQLLVLDFDVLNLLLAQGLFLPRDGLLISFFVIFFFLIRTCNNVGRLVAIG